MEIVYLEAQHGKSVLEGNFSAKSLTKGIIVVRRSAGASWKIYITDVFHTHIKKISHINVSQRRQRLAFVMKGSVCVLTNSWTRMMEDV
jgi:hypothetical protein